MILLFTRVTKVYIYRCIGGIPHYNVELEAFLSLKFSANCAAFGIKEDSAQFVQPVQAHTILMLFYYNPFGGRGYNLYTWASDILVLYNSSPLGLK